MAIDRIPGVGPANSDIAAAVAAPSAATIAAAVAAPSSATIASAVAAAVPTISAINSSVASNAPSPNNWVYLGNLNLSGVSSATISFSAYRKLKIIVPRIIGNVSVTQSPGIRLNGDSSEIYSNATGYTVSGATSTSWSQGYSNNRINLVQSNLQTNSSFVGIIEIDNAHTNNTKNYSVTIGYRDGGAGSNVRRTEIGTYINTTPITSLTFFCASSQPFQTVVENQTAVQVFGVN
jgi:hypothetical protein